MTEAPHPEKRAVGITLIAIGKLIKVTLLVAAGVATLAMAHDAPTALAHWANELGVDASNRWLHRLVAEVSGVTPHRLDEIGLGSFVYASVFSIEGVGLWLQKRWAEHVTLIITLSFLPLEIYEIAHHLTTPKVMTLALNVAALAYLVVRLMAGRAHARLGTASR